MSNKSQKSKTNITKITASSSQKIEPSEPAKVTEQTQTPATTTTEKVAKIQKPAKDLKKSKKDKKNKSDDEKPLKEVFILVRPFVALGRYLRDSWREIRQVRWPNRKATWKMTLAVLIYCAIFMAFILILDTFFTFIFNLVLGTN